MAFPIHQVIWTNDPHSLKSYLMKLKESDELEGVNEFDNRGNAPIHLCLMLNRKDCLAVLLEHGNPDCRLQNREGWSPLAEAISLGNRDIIAMILRHRHRQMKSTIDGSLPHLFTELQNLKDFQMEMNWEFRSWIPFVSSLCPSDVNHVGKRHSSVRFDTTIAGFEKMRWIRGSLSFLVQGNKDPEEPNLESMSGSEMKEMLESLGLSHSDCIEKSDLQNKLKRYFTTQDLKNSQHRGKVLVMNHNTKSYTMVTDEMDKGTDLDHMINILMASPRTSTVLSTEGMAYKPAKGGFWPWQYDKEEEVAGYLTKVYDISGINLVTKVRTEHTGKVLPEDGDEDEGPSDDVNEEEMKASMQEMLRFKNSLSPPPPPSISADEYFDPAERGAVNLGRPQILQKRVRSFKSKVWCSEHFPLSLAQLLTVLRPLASSSVFVQRIVEFLEFDLPPGFPVKIEVPVLPMLSVQVTFQNFTEGKANINLFQVPLDYKETDQVT